MMKQLDIKEIQKINDELQGIQPEVLSSVPQLSYQMAIKCAIWRSYTGEMMAIAKKDWQDAKKKAYESFIISNEANRDKVDRFGVMVVKDYIAAKCGDFEARYEYIERTNNALGSMEDVLRSVISAIKQEMYSSQRA